MAGDRLDVAPVSEANRGPTGALHFARQCECAPWGVMSTARAILDQDPPSALASATSSSRSAVAERSEDVRVARRSYTTSRRGRDAGRVEPGPTTPDVRTDPARTN